MKLYNSLTRKKEKFVPLEKGKVKIYSCGQTVYRPMHIGNMYAYSYWDVLVRYLRWRGYDVYWIMNITDLGHLTGDVDSGEDKIEKEAREKNIEPMVLVETEIKHFFEELDAYNISRADIYPRATGHINEMIVFIEELLNKGYAYEVNGSVYFDTTKVENYGELNPSIVEEGSAGWRIEVNPEKRNPRDFALWIKAPPEHLMKWKGPWSWGYPYWHIECSTMAQKYLGDTIDIHTGGIEHLMGHHPNEMAQSEARTEKPYSRFWLHNQHVTFGGSKMSKSEGNTVLARNLLKQYDPIVLRFFLVNSHYQKAVDFNKESIEQAQTLVERIRDTLILVEQLSGGSETTLTTKIEKVEKEFIDAMDDNLNYVGAVHAVMRFVKEVNTSTDNTKALLISAKNKIVELLGVLGIDILKLIEKPTVEHDLARTLLNLIVKIREDIRNKKMFDLSDKIREELEDIGIKLEDKEEKTIWKYEKV